MYKSWIALTVSESQLFDPSFWLLAPCRRDKRDLWDSVLHTTERQTETCSLEEDPSVLYRRFFESDPFARKTEENSKDWKEQHKRRMENEVNVCPSNRAPICYNIYDRNDYEKLLEKKMAHFWIVQQSYGDEYFEALKVSERIL